MAKRTCEHVWGRLIMGMLSPLRGWGVKVAKAGDICLTCGARADGGEAVAPIKLPPRSERAR